LEYSWPEDGLVFVENCPVCGSSERECLYQDLEDVVFFAAPGKWTFYRCLNCRSGYLDPRPSDNTLHIAYKNYYTHEKTVNFSDLSLKNKLRRMLSNAYRNHHYGTNDNPSIFFGYYLLKMRSVDRAIIDRGMRNLPVSGKGKSLLDVGCGNSSYLLRVKSAGWHVTGIDSDKQVVDNGQKDGLDIKLGDITVLNSQKDCYDVITLSHVIEHVPDPQQLLRNCFRLLNNNGTLWIETPNISATGHSLYGRHWRGLEVPRHLVILSPESLKSLLIKTGFTNIKILPYVPLCESIFKKSSAIASGLDPYKSNVKIKIPSGMKLSEAEMIAKNQEEKREFISLKAFKN